MVSQTLADAVGQALLARGWTVATAESCTGGGIASALTDIAGSSQWVSGGVVTYSNQMKHDLLNVPQDMLRDHGAVSEPVARAMAAGVQSVSGAQVTVSATGIAGPGGAVPGKPVGTVYIGLLVCPDSSQAPLVDCVARCQFDGDRAQVREQTIRYALQAILDGVTKNTV